MEIRQNMSVHNRYDIAVRDAVTGKLKQEAVAYNVVCNGYFRLLLDGSGHNLFYEIVFGSGSGTPAITDGALFNKIGDLTTTDIETVYAYPTSHRSVQVVLNAESYNDSTITEVGIIGRDTTEVSHPTALISHAMIQDSEGHQIAIQKTNTDVVYITATFFVTCTLGGFGSNGVYPAAANNSLIKFALGTGWKDHTNSTYFRTYPRNLTQSDQLETRYLFSKTHNFRALGNVSERTLSLTVTDLSDEGGTQSCRCVGFPGVGAFNFPDASVMERYAVTNKAVGAGDGMTSDFRLGVPCIKSGTAHIYVDGTEMTEGVDFTIDYDSNDTDNYGNYHSAALSLFDNPDQVVWGDAASRAVTHNNTSDPVAMIPGKIGLDTYAEYGYVSNTNPIWLDFLSAKECNTLKMTDTAPSGQLDNLVIEHSQDNETWTPVSYARTGQVYKWALVSARYWRVYIRNYTWQYSFRNKSNVIRDGASATYACFFLGKSVPALHFMTPPASGTVITASYDLDVPYKTGNNLIRITLLITLNRD